MNVVDLKKAATMLRLLDYNGVLHFQADLNQQLNHLENVLAEMKMGILRLISSKNSMTSTVESWNFYLDSIFLNDEKQFISDNQAIISKIKTSSDPILDNASAEARIESGGSIFNMPVELKTMINNYTGDKPSTIYLKEIQWLISNITSVIKSYIKDTDKKSMEKNINLNTVEKFDKIIKNTAADISSIISFKHSMNELLDITNNAVYIVERTGYTGDSLMEFLNSNFSRIRGEMGV